MPLTLHSKKNGVPVYILPDIETASLIVAASRVYKEIHGEASEEIYDIITNDFIDRLLAGMLTRIVHESKIMTEDMLWCIVRVNRPSGKSLDVTIGSLPVSEEESKLTYGVLYDE